MNGEKYFAGDQVTWIDFSLHKDLQLDKLESHPALKDFMHRMEQNTKVQEMTNDELKML